MLDNRSGNKYAQGINDTKYGTMSTVCVEMDTMSVDQGEIIAVARGKPSPQHPLGRQAFDRKGFEAYQLKPLESKREYLKQQWANVSYMVLTHATALCMSLSKKDYGKLVQLMTSAGIAYDKVFPKEQASVQLNLVQNLFNGLPQGKVVEVIGGTPQASIDVANAIPIPCPPSGDDTPLA